MRFLNWPQLLAESLEQARLRPFAYGTHDCLQFPAAQVAAITGVDYAAEFPAYASKTAALRLIARYGSMEGLVRAALQRNPVEPAQAMRGDVVLGSPPLAFWEEGEAAGICLGAKCAFATDVGYVLVPRSVARLAWRIE